MELTIQIPQPESEGEEAQYVWQYFTVTNNTDPKKGGAKNTLWFVTKTSVVVTLPERGRVTASDHAARNSPCLWYRRRLTEGYLPRSCCGSNAKQKNRARPCRSGRPGRVLVPFSVGEPCSLVKLHVARAGALKPQLPGQLRLAYRLHARAPGEARVAELLVLAESSSRESRLRDSESGRLDQL
jgi:hypothetical protein